MTSGTASDPASARLPSLSACFPVHDEAENVVPMTEAMLRVLPTVAARWELIVVDDGSRDGTAALVDRLAREHANVRVVRHERNRGYGAAVRSGLAACRHDYVFLTDGDRQFDPADLVALLPHLAHADVVVGYRETRADPLPRRLNTAGWNFLVRTLLRLPVRDVNCAFKLLRRDATAGLTLRSDGALLPAELLARVAQRGRRIVEVPVRHHPRVAGIPSGGRPGVVLRAFGELVRLGRELRSDTTER